jgi:hypothetical protein
VRTRAVLDGEALAGERAASLDLEARILERDGEALRRAVAAHRDGAADARLLQLAMQRREIDIGDRERPPRRRPCAPSPRPLAEPPPGEATFRSAISTLCVLTVTPRRRRGERKLLCDPRGPDRRSRCAPVPRRSFPRPRASRPPRGASPARAVAREVHVLACSLERTHRHRGEGFEAHAAGGALAGDLALERRIDRLQRPFRVTAAL